MRQPTQVRSVVRGSGVPGMDRFRASPRRRFVSSARGGMKCPFCQTPDTRVIDSRVIGDGVSIRRRRQCPHCDQRFTTYERMAETPLSVIKRDDSRVPFDRQKIVSGVLKACYKRPVSNEQIENLAGEIETELLRRGEQEVKSTAVGEMVMERLRRLDQVAYVRFASVYRNFTDLADFSDVIGSILDSNDAGKPNDRTR
jgi:transcriptional repressor NrdR